ncbi:hypothetical protein TPHA_0H01480 [Tetrapisispora phaffii CBS 4417]|uniref:Exosome complex protein n=1 Tax=Tetrapisispora phaffii (strain ATCC 24235 / CBS 4417 / NBRC 1672 / NRRL Y-8282 / UCD 70-5) TaxID=1071381 RepID=G8BX50_TETPH|nr:hypothetical protein TPHA_0H01480 [Tetrapisispora phaffii CBS 4417]CCE64354.1 hypothetical protein TPHA_0H01480 [Tetrapisispora phaffii CBS 4417]
MLNTRFHTYIYMYMYIDGHSAIDYTLTTDQHSITMDNDIKKFKLYLNHLNKQLNALKPQLEKLISHGSLDDMLINLNSSNNIELEKLKLVNHMAYILTSLLFINTKLYNVKDNSRIMGELNKVKEYMGRYDTFKNKAIRSKDEKSQAKEQIAGVLQNSAISYKNFERKGKINKYKVSKK